MENSSKLDTFYKTKKTDFQEVNGKKVMTVSKDISYVADPWALAEFVCEERNISINNSIIRVGIDGGQGSLKGYI